MPQRYYGQDPWGWGDAGEGIAGLIMAIRNRDKQEADYWMEQLQMDRSVLQNPRAVEKISKHYPWVVSPTTPQQFVQNRGQVPLTGAPIPGLGGEIQPMYSASGIQQTGERQASLLDDTIKRLLGGTQPQTRLATGKKGLVNVRIPGRMPTEKEYATGEKLFSQRELTARELGKEQEQTLREIQKQRLASMPAIQKNWQERNPNARPKTVQLLTRSMLEGSPMPDFTIDDLEGAIDKNAENQKILEDMKGQWDVARNRVTQQEQGIQQRLTERARAGLPISAEAKFRAEEASRAVIEAARIRAGAAAAGKELTPEQRSRIMTRRASYINAVMEQFVNNPANMALEEENPENYNKLFSAEQRRAGEDFDARVASSPAPQAGAPYQDQDFDSLMESLRPPVGAPVPRGTQPALRPVPAHAPPATVKSETEPGLLEGIRARIRSISEEELLDFLGSLPSNIIRKLFGK